MRKSHKSLSLQNKNKNRKLPKQINGSFFGIRLIYYKAIPIITTAADKARFPLC